MADWQVNCDTSAGESQIEVTILIEKQSAKETGETLVDQLKR